MSDRVFGLITALLALAFFAAATQLEEPFFSDPVGPKTFPILISIVAFMAGSYMIIRPDPNPQWPNLATAGRLSFALIILTAYAYALVPVGFLLSTFMAASLLSYQIKPNKIHAVIIGALLAIGLFVIFKYALGLSLFAFPRWLVG